MLANVFNIWHVHVLTTRSRSAMIYYHRLRSDEQPLIWARLKNQQSPSSRAAWKSQTIHIRKIESPPHHKDRRRTQHLKIHHISWTCTACNTKFQLPPGERPHSPESCLEHLSIQFHPMQDTMEKQTTCYQKENWKMRMRYNTVDIPLSCASLRKCSHYVCTSAETEQKYFYSMMFTSTSTTQHSQLSFLEDIKSYYTV